LACILLLFKYLTYCLAYRRLMPVKSILFILSSALDDPWLPCKLFSYSYCCCFCSIRCNSSNEVLPIPSSLFLFITLPVLFRNLYALFWVAIGNACSCLLFEFKLICIFLTFVICYMLFNWSFLFGFLTSKVSLFS
jgi:hypothetical protein